jgi:hypothetical protein
MVKWAKGILIWSLLGSLLLHFGNINAQQSTQSLRMSFHIFQDDGGRGNFHEDSVAHLQFLHELNKWINQKAIQLDTLYPAATTDYVPSLGIQIIVDTILFHQDNYAWNCEKNIDSEYMRKRYVDQDTSLNYRQKHQTLPVFIGGNYPVVGGHNSMSGNKRYIALRGLFSEYQNKEYKHAVYECSRNLLHEIGHALGLSHNFREGEHGDQCDECEDNGCPVEGTSNNIMDYWPSYGHAISVCQYEIIRSHLDSERGNIADIIINDSCYINSAADKLILVNEKLKISDTVYFHQSVEIKNGGELFVEGYLSLPDDATILVHPGGKLVISGGTIGNLCGDLWYGIQIGKEGAGQYANPQVIIENGGVLAFAQTALIINNQVNIALNKCRFINCQTSVFAGPAMSDTLKIRNSTFLANNRFPHSEVGAGLQRFIACEGAIADIDSCMFVNQDPFRTNLSDGAGNGVETTEGTLIIRSSRFENLNRGILAIGRTDTSYLYADNLTIIFCVAGIQLFQTARAIIKNSNFQIERFNEQIAFGLYAEEIAWLNLTDNHFFSYFGGEQQIAVLIDHPRGGTQLIHGNSLSKMEWGILHLADTGEPAWPEDIFDKMDMATLNRDLGLVLMNNTIEETNNHYALLLPDGKGLTSMDSPPKASDQYFEAAAHWPVGGLALLSSLNEIGLIQGPAKGNHHLSLDHNFYLNDRANKTNEFSDDTIAMDPNIWFSHLQTQWLAESFPALIPNSLVETWALAEEKMLSNPYWGRRSQERDLHMEDVEIWPVWALHKLAKLSHNTVVSEDFTIKAIYQLASHQFDVLEEDWHQIDLVSGNLIHHSVRLGIPILEPAFRPLVPVRGDYNSGFKVYPNPAINELFVRPEKDFFKTINLPIGYSVFDADGSLAMQGRICNFNDLKLNLLGFKPGLYILSIWSPKRFLGRRKFIILRD